MNEAAGQSFTLPRTDEGLRALSGQIAAALEALEAPPKLTYKAELVAEEIFTNLVKYGAPSGTPDEVALRMWIDTTGLTLMIEDRTVPFSPVWAPEANPQEDIATAQPGGLGLSLVRQTASELTYDSLTDGNRLVARLTP